MHADIGDRNCAPIAGHAQGRTPLALQPPKEFELTINFCLEVILQKRTSAGHLRLIDRPAMDV